MKRALFWVIILFSKILAQSPPPPPPIPRIHNVPIKLDLIFLFIALYFYYKIVGRKK